MKKRLEWLLWPLLGATLGAAQPQRQAQPPAAAPAAAAQPRQIAVTIDDLPVVSVLPAEFGKQLQITVALLASLQAHRVPAIGFVNEGKLADNGMSEAQGLRLLRAWVTGGMELGNHTYAHADFHLTPLPQMETQVVQGERATKTVLEAAGKKLQFFRHPYLHTGLTPDIRRQFETFLTSRGYRIAPVTIDNYDYVFAAALDRAVTKGDSALQARILAEYPLYMERVVAYYEQQAQALFGRNIKQTLLLHANALNARAFNTLASMLERRGYSFISLEQALADPAYRTTDTYAGPAGISWIHRWALSAGRTKPFFDGEPVVPDWVTAASQRPPVVK
ncbi:MAG: polysaccharide deacetylase family protein [Vicinamibacterales bacterium]